MALSYDILKLLSDGHFHSGEQLARRLSVTRAAIWKALKQLSSKYDIDVHSVRGRGYRLASALELLDHTLIKQAMHHAPDLVGLETYLSIDSTNKYLMELATRKQAGPYVVFSEHQSGGRGRRGRQWISPFGGNIYMSLLWRFKQVPAELMGLSLAVGVSLCRALRLLGIEEIALKWPNDILCQGRKLCGILAEMHGETNGPYAVVIGLGLNIHMSDRAASMIDQPWIAMDEITTQPIARNKLAALLADHLLEAMQQFEQNGLETFLADWQTLDAYRDTEIVLYLAEQQIGGIARGIDSQGALLIEQNGQLRRFFSGEISLRART